MTVIFKLQIGIVFLELFATIIFKVSRSFHFEDVVYSHVCVCGGGGRFS